MYKDGAEVEVDGSKYQTVEKVIDSSQYESILRVFDVQESDYGTYICDAKNEMGNDTFQIDFVASSKCHFIYRFYFFGTTPYFFFIYFDFYRCRQEKQTEKEKNCAIVRNVYYNISLGR